MFDSLRAYGREFRTLWRPPFGIVCLYIIAGWAAVYLSGLVGAAFYLITGRGETSIKQIIDTSMEQPFPLPAQIVVGLIIVIVRGLLAVTRKGILKEFLWLCVIMVGYVSIGALAQVFLKGWLAFFSYGFWYAIRACVFYEFGRYLINNKYYREAD